MDLSEKGNLSQGEKQEVAERLQALFLWSLGRRTDWAERGDWAFHGGTCLRVTGRSVRWSEDLDFMVRDELRSGMDALMGDVMKDVRDRAEVLWPGCEIEMKPPKRREGILAAVSNYQVRWSHPKRNGSVKVKNEFFGVAADALASYDARPETLESVAGTAARYPIASDCAVFADKTVAVAERASLKWRDVYDLAIVGKGPVGTERRHSEADLQSALSATCDIYGVDPAEVAEKLESLLRSGRLEDEDAFREDLARWLPDGGFDSRDASDRLASARDYVARQIDVLRGMEPERKPTP